MDEQLYEIQDGVRRAKAAWLCGQETIAARIDGSGEIIQVPIPVLLSPKARIEDIGPRGGSWGTIYRSLKWRYRPMNSNFFDSVIRATHRVIITVRFHAYKNTDPQTLARMLDYADPLGFVLMDHHPAKNEAERVSLFRQRLQDIEETFQGFNGLVASFDENMKRGESISEPPRELAAASL